MKRDFDSLRITAYFLLAFLVVVGVAVWLLNLITQWRVFGFLMSAEFTAFAMLVYLFYMEDPVAAKKLLTSGFVALGILVILAGAVLAGVGAPVTLPKPNVSVTLYAGEISSTIVRIREQRNLDNLARSNLNLHSWRRREHDCFQRGNHAT